MALPTKKGIFVVCFIPIVVLLTPLTIEYFWLWGIDEGITQGWQEHKSDIKKIVLRYTDKFTPTELNNTKYDIISQTISTETSQIIKNIEFQLGVSIILVLIIGSLFSINNARALPKYYNNTEGIEKSQFFFQAQSTITTSISGAVSVVVALVGSISLLSPNIIGGYVIAGIQALLICIILGIIAHGVGSDAVKKTDTSKNTVTLNSLDGAYREGLISIQFLLLSVGISLLVIQILFF